MLLKLPFLAHMPRTFQAQIYSQTILPCLSLYLWVRSGFSWTFFPLWVIIMPIITLDALPQHNSMFLSHRFILASASQLVSGAQEDLAVTQHSLNCSELLRLNRNVVARNLSIKARQRPVSWLQGEVETPRSLHHLPRGCITRGCHFNKAINPVPLARLALFHPLRNAWHIIISRLCLPWLSTLHPIGMPCIFSVVTPGAGIIFCFVCLSLCSQNNMSSKVQRCWVMLIPLCAVYVHTVCPLYISFLE